MTITKLDQVKISTLPLTGQIKKALLDHYGDVSVYELDGRRHKDRPANAVPGLGRKRWFEVVEAIETVAAIVRLRRSRDHAYAADRLESLYFRER